MNKIVYCVSVHTGMVDGQDEYEFRQQANRESAISYAMRLSRAQSGEFKIMQGEKETDTTTRFTTVAYAKDSELFHPDYLETIVVGWKEAE